MTAQTLIYGAMRAAGVMGGAQFAPSSSMLADGLHFLNLMLSAWNNDPLKKYAETVTTFVLTPATRSYTIGASGTINVPRPEKITRARILTATDTRSPLEIVSSQRWAQIVSQAVDSVPSALWYETAYPLATIHLYPGPDAAYSLELYTDTRIATFATVADVVTLPAGYEEAITYNLAIRLAVAWKMPIPPDVRIMAREALIGIEQQNSIAEEMECDHALLRNGGRYPYNILTNR